MKLRMMGGAETTVDPVWVTSKSGESVLSAVFRSLMVRGEGLLRPLTGRVEIPLSTSKTAGSELRGGNDAVISGREEGREGEREGGRRERRPLVFLSCNSSACCIYP